MKIPRFKIIPILIGLLACQAHACQSLRKKGWYVKIYKADYVEQLKEFKMKQKPKKKNYLRSFKKKRIETIFLQ